MHKYPYLAVRLVSHCTQLACKLCTLLCRCTIKQCTPHQAAPAVQHSCSLLKSRSHILQTNWQTKVAPIVLSATHVCQSAATDIEAQPDLTRQHRLRSAPVACLSHMFSAAGLHIEVKLANKCSLGVVCKSCCLPSCRYRDRKHSLEKTSPGSTRCAVQLQLA